MSSWRVTGEPRGEGQIGRLQMDERQADTEVQGNQMDVPHDD